MTEIDTFNGKTDTQMIDPYIKIKAQIFARATPSYILQPDRTLLRQYHFSEAEQAVLNRCDEVIKWILDSGGAVRPRQDND